MKRILVLTIFFFSFSFPTDRCSGNILRQCENGLEIYLKIEDSTRCWIDSDFRPYYIKRKNKSMEIKILPPSKKVVSDSFTDNRVSKGRTHVRMLSMQDSLLLYWKGLKKDNIALVNKNGEISHLVNFRTFLPKDAVLDSFTYLKKGEHLILDIPCLDEETAKRAPPFHITKTQYPFMRCVIDPAQRDYYGE